MCMNVFLDVLTINISKGKWVWWIFSTNQGLTLSLLCTDFPLYPDPLNPESLSIQTKSDGYTFLLSLKWPLIRNSHPLNPDTFWAKIWAILSQNLGILAKNWLRNDNCRTQILLYLFMLISWYLSLHKYKEKKLKSVAIKSEIWIYNILADDAITVLLVKTPNPLPSTCVIASSLTGPHDFFVIDIRQDNYLSQVKIEHTNSPFEN